MHRGKRRVATRTGARSAASPRLSPFASHVPRPISTLARPPGESACTGTHTFGCPGSPAEPSTAPSALSWNEDSAWDHLNHPSPRAATPRSVDLEHSEILILGPLVPASDRPLLQHRNHGQSSPCPPCPPRPSLTPPHAPHAVYEPRQAPRRHHRREAQVPRASSLSPRRRCPQALDRQQQQRRRRRCCPGPRRVGIGSRR